MSKKKISIEEDLKLEERRSKALLALKSMDEKHELELQDWENKRVRAIAKSAELAKVAPNPKKVDPKKMLLRFEQKWSSILHGVVVSQEQERRSLEEELHKIPLFEQVIESEKPDGFFYHGDSDSDDDFQELSKGIETHHGLTHDEKEPPILDADGATRRCLEVDRCYNFQHKQEFDGLPCLELFKVKARLSEHYSRKLVRGRIYGEIATLKADCDRHNPNPIPYYSMSREEAGEIRLDAKKNNFVLLPISGPVPRPAFFEGYDLHLCFALKMDGKDMFHDGFPQENPRLFGNNDACTAASMCLRACYDGNTRLDGSYTGRRVIGCGRDDRVLLGANYSVYYGSWATIDVKLLKKSVTSFYGSILARPCIFTSRIRLLTIQPDNKVTIERNSEGEESGGSIKLTRSVVAIPSYASLIIGAQLYDDKNKLFFCGKTYFRAKESGEETRIIAFRGARTLQVHVKWECRR